MKRLDRFAGVTAQRPTAYTIPNEGQFHDDLEAVHVRQTFLSVLFSILSISQRQQAGMPALPDWHLPRSADAS
jgi:hypothetical protein